jgi:hypothetical protein
MSTSASPPPPSSMLPAARPSVRLELAQAVAAAAAGVTGVAGLSPGPGVPIVTLGGADSVTGVRLTAERVEVHVVADRFPLPEVIAAVTEAVLAVLRGRGDQRDVFVRVEDVALGDSLADDTEVG